MVCNKLAPMKGLHFGIPFLLGGSQAFVKVLKTLLKIAGVGRVEVPELSRDSFSYATAIVRVKPVMRISQGMDITHGPGYGSCRNIQNFRKLRSVKIAVGANLDSSVSALRNQRRKPAYLQL